MINDVRFSRLVAVSADGGPYVLVLGPFNAGTVLTSLWVWGTCLAGNVTSVGVDARLAERSDDTFAAMVPLIGGVGSAVTVTSLPCVPAVSIPSIITNIDPVTGDVTTDGGQVAQSGLPPSRIPLDVDVGRGGRFLVVTLTPIAGDWKLSIAVDIVGRSSPGLSESQRPLVS